MLAGAQTRIQGWWAQAYDGVLSERFRLEAQASLPLVGGGAGVRGLSNRESQLPHVCFGRPNLYFNVVT
jgi:hypothetical protein